MFLLNLTRKLKLDRLFVPWEVWIARFMIRFGPIADDWSFLKEVSGVIHIGANKGQERHLYKRLSLKVIWIEPLPDIFQILEKNISGFPGQTAYQRLFTDVDDKEYQLQIASNEGAASSIFDPGEVKKICPEITFDKKVSIKSTTLASFVLNEHINISSYDALVMDVQGAELLVLQGTGNILSQFKFIKLEAATFELYKGACQLQDLDAYLTENGFKQLKKYPFGSQNNETIMCDVVYTRQHDLIPNNKISAQ